MQAVVADKARFQRRILLLLPEGLGIAGVEAESFEEARGAATGEIRFLDLSVLPPAPPNLWREGVSGRFVVTGEAARDEELAAWIRSGSDGFLLKPFTRDALARVLEDLDLS